MEESLDLPPFPPLEWEEYYWTGSVQLSAWAGFPSRLRGYGADTTPLDSDGSADLNLVTPDDEQATPSPEQATAFEQLMAHQEATRDAILDAIFAHYLKWQERYGYDEEEAQKKMPNIERPDQLKPLLRLLIVRIFNAAKNDVAYVGFQFGCTWDDEHGLGVMTHAGRVVEVGGADTAILEWIAQNDLEASE